MSKVVAAVRGTAISGPMQSALRKHRTKALFGVSCRCTEWTKPPRAFTKASSASTDNPASARMYIRKPENQFLPQMTPSAGGRIRFPAPKNMANRAKPSTITCPKNFFSFMETCLSLIVLTVTQFGFPLWYIRHRPVFSSFFFTVFVPRDPASPPPYKPARCRSPQRPCCRPCAPAPQWRGCHGAYTRQGSALCSAPR